jgi:hypothetical protein
LRVSVTACREEVFEGLGSVSNNDHLVCNAAPLECAEGQLHVIRVVFDDENDLSLHLHPA